MAIRLREHPDSRELTFGSQGGGQYFHLTAITTNGESETEVWLYVMSQSTPYYNGFIRQSLVVKPLGGPLFDVVIQYGTAGVGGGDQPVGGVAGDGSPPTAPTAPAGASDPLLSGYSFSVNCPRIHFTQSRVTISATGRGAIVAPDYKGAIGIDLDGRIQGCDFPPDPRTTFSRTWGRATVTQGYVSDLTNLAGRPNDAPFYGWNAGEVILMSAQGQYTQGEGWSITANFGVEENEVDIEICDGLTVPAKRGWDYLWVLYRRNLDGNELVTLPDAAYVEEILRSADFSLMGIG
jgi:hypothetical protein